MALSMSIAQILAYEFASTPWKAREIAYIYLLRRMIQLMPGSVRVLAVINGRKVDDIIQMLST